MGTVLAMIKQTLTLGLLTLFGACGPLNEGNIGLDAARQIGTLVGIAPAPPAPSVAPNIANAAPGDVLLVTIVNRNAVAPLTKAQINGNRVTWISPGDVSMTFADGVLIGTRGLSEDLMGADANGVRAAIRAGGGTATRRHSFLTSLDQIRTRSMTCTITQVAAETLTLVSGTAAAIKYDESCTGEMVFTNSYWVDASTGAMLRSLQVVSASDGYIQADQL